MTLTYVGAVKVFVVSVLLCGIVHVLGPTQEAGYMLLATGLVAMAVTVGSATGYMEVIGRDGRTIPAATWLSYPTKVAYFDRLMLNVDAGTLTVVDACS